MKSIVCALFLIVFGALPSMAGEHASGVLDLTGTGAQDTAIATHVHALYPDAGAVFRA